MLMEAKAFARRRLEAPREPAAVALGCQPSPGHGGRAQQQEALALSPRLRAVQVKQTPDGTRVEVYTLPSGARLYVPLGPSWNFKAARSALARAEARR